MVTLGFEQKKTSTSLSLVYQNDARGEPIASLISLMGDLISQGGVV